MRKFIIKAMEYLIFNKSLNEQYEKYFKVKPIGDIHAVSFIYPLIEFVDFTPMYGISSREINIYKYLFLNTFTIIKNLKSIKNREIKYINNYWVSETKIFLKERINNF